MPGAYHYDSATDPAPHIPCEKPAHTTPASDDGGTVSVFHTIDVLDEQQCLDVLQTVHALKPHWIDRSAAVPFFTLGSASYLDAKDDYAHYLTLAQRYNPLLRRHLNWLYLRVAEVLSQHFGAPAVYNEQHALPGFHVYLGCPLFEKPIASIHYDSQYELLQWHKRDELDFAHPCTFTLVIALPRSGGGLYYWDVDREQLVAHPNQPLNSVLAEHCRHYQPYRLGTMVVHSGHTLHQIAPGRGLQIDDERITLQGHALQRGDRWELYW